MVVGNYYHELNADLTLSNVYQNGVVGNKENPGRYEWKMFEVGTTRYNDEAIRLAGMYLIDNAFSKFPLQLQISDPQFCVR